LVSWKFWYYGRFWRKEEGSGRREGGKKGREMGTFPVRPELLENPNI
jgi:hypothetical protein